MLSSDEQEVMNYLKVAMEFNKKHGANLLSAEEIEAFGFICDDIELFKAFYKVWLMCYIIEDECETMLVTDEDGKIVSGVAKKYNGLDVTEYTIERCNEFGFRVFMVSSDILNDNGFPSYSKFLERYNSNRDLLKEEIPFGLDR